MTDLSQHPPVEEPATPDGDEGSGRVNIENIRDSEINVGGDIVGRDKVVENIAGDKIVQNVTNNITQIIRNPALWQDAIWTFVRQHRLFLAVAAVLLLGLLAIYWPFKDLYLISWEYWTATAVLLLIAAWGWYTLGGIAGRLLGRTNPVRLGVTSLATVAVVGLIGWQAYRIIRPGAFEPQVFGIALAELGEGAGLRRTAAAREITDEVYRQLCEEISRAFEEAEGPCEPRQTTPDGRPIAVQRIGIVSDVETARAIGQRIEADIVIWGRVRSTREGVTISYTVLESLDQAVNPEYPIVLPVVVKTIDFTSGTIDQENIEEAVTSLATVMARFTLGLQAYLDLEFAQAVGHLEGAVGSLPVETARTNAEARDFDLTDEGRSLIYFYLGRSYVWLQRDQEGEQWLSLGREANPTEPAFDHSLAQVYDRLDRPDERDAAFRRALDKLDAWLDTHPDDPTAYYDRAQIFQVYQKPDNVAFAEFDYEETLRLNPDFLAAYISLAWLYHDQGRFDEAISRLEEVITIAEESGASPAWAYLSLGTMRWRSGDMDLAGDAFRQAIELDPTEATFYYDYARFLEEDGQIDAAAANYEKLPELTSNRGWAYQQIAQFWERHGRFDEAVRNYERAIREERGDMLLRYYLARLYFDKLGDPAKAFEVYETAVATNPGPENVGTDLLYLGYGFHLSRADDPDLEKAVQMYERALEIRPFNWFGIDRLAILYEQLGRPDDAAALYQRVVDNPDQFAENELELARDSLEQLQ